MTREKHGGIEERSEIKFLRGDNRTQRTSRAVRIMRSN